MPKFSLANNNGMKLIFTSNDNDDLHLMAVILFTSLFQICRRK